MKLKQEHSGLINFNNRMRFNPNDNIIIHEKDEMIWGKQTFDPESITELERKDGDRMDFEGDAYDLAEAVGAFFFTINYVGGMARFTVKDPLGGIPNVLVSVNGAVIETDENGFMEVSLERGRYLIRFDKEGFISEEFEFEMKEGENLAREVFLTNESIIAVYDKLDGMTLKDISGNENHAELGGSYVLSGNGLDNLVDLDLRMTEDMRYEIKGRFTSLYSERTSFASKVKDLDIHTWEGTKKCNLYLLGHQVDGKYYFANFDLYYCKVWNKEELIMDIEPRDGGSWIYDKVSNRGFRVQGTQGETAKPCLDQYNYNLLDGFDLYDYRVPIGVTGEGEFRGTYPAVENGLNCSENALPFDTEYFVDDKNPRRFVVSTNKNDERVWQYVKKD